MTFDMIAYSRLWRDRQGRFVSATALTRGSLAREIEALSKAAMERLIYSIPEDVSASGRQLWTRTRSLINGEKAILRGTGDIVLTNAVAYAEPRHEAGKPGRRPINPLRFAPWRDLIRDELRGLQLETYRQALLGALSGRLSGNPVSGGADAGAGGGGGAGGGIPNPVPRPGRRRRLFPARRPRSRR